MITSGVFSAIIAIVVCVFCLNAVLLVVWCSRRKSRRVHSSRKYDKPEVTRHEKDPVVTTIIQDTPSSKEKQSYYQLIQSTGVPFTTPRSQRPRLSPSRPRISVPVLPHSHLQPIETQSSKVGVSCEVDAAALLELPRHRSIDAETASIYTSASAPLELHDRLFRTQPFVLNERASARSTRCSSPQPSCLPHMGITADTKLASTVASVTAAPLPGADDRARSCLRPRIADPRSVDRASSTRVPLQVPPEAHVRITAAIAAAPRPLPSSPPLGAMANQSALSCGQPGFASTAPLDTRPRNKQAIIPMIASDRIAARPPPPQSPSEASGLRFDRTSRPSTVVWKTS